MLTFLILIAYVLPGLISIGFVFIAMQTPLLQLMLINTDHTEEGLILALLISSLIPLVNIVLAYYAIKTIFTEL